MYQRNPQRVGTSLLLISAILAVSGERIVRAGDFATERLQNWHHWRGPDANGVSPLGDPPTHWDESTNVKWKVEIPGRGGSTPIVWGNRVFVVTAIDTGRVAPDVPKPEDQPDRPFGIKYPNTFHKFVVLCLDRHNGQILWEQVAAEELPHEGHHNDNTFASATPTTDGERLYVSFGSRGLFCYDLAGSLLWKRLLGNVETRLSFGEASSPVIHGDALILTRDNERNSQIFALDARTGETRWKADRDEVSDWATPLVVEHRGRTQVIANASKRVRSYDLSNGELIWECGGQVSNVIPSPIVSQGVLYCMSGYKGSAALAISLDSRGDVTDSNSVAWKYPRDTPYVPSPLLYGDRLYFTKSNSGILTCLAADSGKPLFEATRVQGLNNVYSSPVGAANRIYITGREGTTVVLKRSATVEILATNKLADAVDASPAVVGKQLFLRGHKYLYCFETKE